MNYCSLLVHKNSSISLTSSFHVDVLKFDNYLINIHSHFNYSLLIHNFMFMYIYYDKSLMYTRARFTQEL